MNNERRAELLEVLAELSRQYPDWRLGQLVANVAGWADHPLWDVEDEQLLAAAQLHLAAGDDRDETIALMQEAIAFHLEGMAAERYPIPTPRSESAYIEVAEPNALN